MAVMTIHRGVPVHIVEDHNEGLEHIYRAIGKKLLPYNGMVLVHFDSHPDLLSPDMTAAMTYDKGMLYESISISDWILPAVYAGHFGGIIWVKPSWSNQIDNGQYQLTVGRDIDNKQIRVNLALPYFINEGLYRPLKDLEDIQSIPLYVLTLQSETCSIKDDALTSLLTTSTGWVLDVDLDFFSTANPFKHWFTKEQFDHLRNLYEPKLLGTFTEKEAVEINFKRINQLKDLLELWTANDRPLNPNEAEIKSIIGQERSGQIIGAIDIHTAGITSDLPHHISSQDEINSLLDLYGLLLKQLTAISQPALVVIARSSNDDYTPIHQVDYIQQNVTDIISTLFSTTIHKHYQ